MGWTWKYPLDAQLALSDLTLAERAYAIARANEGLMLRMRRRDRQPDAVSRSRPPDTGTAYEVGFMRGLGKPVFGYSNYHLPFFDRVRKFNDDPLKHRPGAEPTMAFEDSERKMGVG